MRKIDGETFPDDSGEDDGGFDPDEDYNQINDEPVVLNQQLQNHTPQKVL